MRMPVIHRIHYSWTGWPTAGTRLPPPPPAPAWDDLVARWSGDGLTPVAHEWRADQVHLTFEAAPEVAPMLCAARAKGRLQHALRLAGTPAVFSRKVAVRALGSNTTEVVRNYLRGQLAHADLADPRYRASLAAASEEDPTADVLAPEETDSGRYWYALHIVLVTNGRSRIGKEDFLKRVGPGIRAWCGEAGGRLKSLALMPDHVHLLVCAVPGLAPVELAEGCWRTVNRAAGCRLYSDRVYVGSCSEYSLDKVLR